MKNPHGILFAFLALLVIAAPAAAATRVPRRIVSLSPGITEILYSLGLGDRVVGDTAFCDYPPDAAKKPHVGDSTINYEAVVGLKPDLVVADALANEQAVPRLESLQIPVLSISVRSVAEVEQAIVKVGAATGEAKAAKRVVATMKAQEKSAESIALQRSGAPLRTLVVVATDPIYVAGSNTFIGGMIALCGADNLASNVGFQTMSKEAAVAGNPEVVFCDADDAKTIEQDPAWNGVDAVRRHNLFSIDSDLLVRPGPRLTLGMIQVATDLAHAH